MLKLRRNSDIEFWKLVAIMKRANVWSINLYHPQHLATRNMEDLEMLHRRRYFQANYPTTYGDDQLLQNKGF
jgi:hypothetical protein